MGTIKKVVCKSIWVRSGPGTNYPKLSLVYRGDQVDISETKGIWNKAIGGWLVEKEGKVICLSVVGESPTPVPPEPTPANPDKKKENKNAQPNEFLLYKADYSTEEANTIRNIAAIQGLPYQFLESVDSRLKEGDGAALGRKYSEKIVSRMPLLLLTPGEPKFMTNYNNKDKEGVINDLLRVAAGAASKSDLDKILSRPGRYYTFEFAHEDYYNYVNAMTRIGARLLKIHGDTLGGVYLDQMDWLTYSKPRLEAFTNMGEVGAVPFYIHSENQITESFSAGTTQSMLASKTNSVSDLGREINFLLGYGANMSGANIDGLSTQDLGENLENTNDVINKILNKSNIVKNVADNLITVASGGKLIFPEIWSDSNFSRSYDINIRLTTPDCDKLSWYFNIYVPLMHLVALAAPRNVDGNPNGYYAPFLVRGYYKGLFSCDMGIITNMTINKGQEGAWTKDGLPTVVDVNFTLKDMYDTLAITSMQKRQYDTMNNTALMDYMANMCGININKPDILRQIDMWFVQNVLNRVTDTILSDIWGKALQNIENTLMNFYKARWFP